LPAPRKYPDELRERAVRLYRESEPRPTFRRLGEQLNVHPEALRNWVRQTVWGSRIGDGPLTCGFRRRVRIRWLPLRVTLPEHARRRRVVDVRRAVLVDRHGRTLSGKPADHHPAVDGPTAQDPPSFGHPQGQAVAGGGLWPVMLFQSWSQAGAQGQRVGRCRTGCRAGRASRAGTVMICRRRVAPRARV